MLCKTFFVTFGLIATSAVAQGMDLDLQVKLPPDETIVGQGVELGVLNTTIAAIADRFYFIRDMISIPGIPPSGNMRFESNVNLTNDVDPLISYFSRTTTLDLEAFADLLPADKMCHSKSFDTGGSDGLVMSGVFTSDHPGKYMAGFEFTFWTGEILEKDRDNLTCIGPPYKGEVIIVSKEWNMVESLSSTTSTPSSSSSSPAASETSTLSAAGSTSGGFKNSGKFDMKAGWVGAAVIMVIASVWV